MDDVRKLVRIETIDSISPATDSDFLELAMIGGWQIVVKKNLHKAGDAVIYAEIDSLIPAHDPRFDFNDNFISQAKDYGDGVSRVRIRTVRLRGNISQGIVFPLEPFPELQDIPVGEDVSQSLNIVKYDPPAPEGSENIVGPFQSRFAMKSDSERVQNLSQLWDDILCHDWICTEKLDGDSTTIVNDQGVIRIMGRNWEIETQGHKIFHVFPEEELLKEIPQGTSIQGEMVGKGIQGNKLKLEGYDFRIYAAYQDGVVIPREQWTPWMCEHSVPVLDIEPAETVADMIERINEMKSTVNTKVLAEGVVFHEKNGDTLRGMSRPNFKVISNKFLLKNE